MTTKTARTPYLILAVFFLMYPLLSKEEEESGRRNPWIVRETPDTIICREANGKEITLHKKPKRVIVAYVSLIGLWYCAGGKAIAIPDTMNINSVPEIARALEKIGRFSSPSMEKVLSLKPDLVLLMERVEKHRAAKEILDRNGIESVLLSYENYKDFLELLDLFTRLNGSTVRENPEASRITGEVNSVLAKTAGLKGPRFISIQASGRDFLNADTPRAHTAYMAEMLGGVNVISSVTISGKEAKRVKLSMEKIMMEDPDVIIISSMGDTEKINGKLKRDFENDEVWKNLRAVKTGKAYFLPNRLFIYRPNEDFPEAFRQLAKIMYPQLKLE